MTPDELRRTVVDLCAQNQKINAIKIYREQTGKGLADAKREVEALVDGAQVELPPLRGASASATAGHAGGASAHVATLLREGKKIEAIRAHRLETGLGLADAKNAVEAMEAAIHRGQSGQAIGASVATFADVSRALNAPPTFGGGGSALGAPPAAAPSAFGAAHAPRERTRFGSEDLERDGRGPSVMVLGLVFVALAVVALGLVSYLYGR